MKVWMPQNARSEASGARRGSSPDCGVGKGAKMEERAVGRSQQVTGRLRLSRSLSKARRRYRYPKARLHTSFSSLVIK